MFKSRACAVEIHWFVAELLSDLQADLPKGSEMLQVVNKCLLWGPTCINRTHSGPFGASGIVAGVSWQVLRRRSQAPGGFETRCCHGTIVRTCKFALLWSACRLTPYPLIFVGIMIRRFGHHSHKMISVFKPVVTSGHTTFRASSLTYAMQDCSLLSHTSTCIC